MRSISAQRGVHGRQTVVTEGGVEDELLVRREGWEVVFFCHASAKLAPKHWTIIVIENIANFSFRSSTVGSRVYLLSRLVPVLNGTR